jgi:ketosteroid isomerase-like protein
MPTAAALEAQEATFARAYAAGDVTLARDLYHPAVEYRSPTVRLFDWPRRIDGIDRTLEFIALTIRECRETRYEAVESAIVPGGESAFVRIHFDWTREGRRLRSSYVVCYRYRDALIGRQELYYDPSAPPRVVGLRSA